jgi:hypothetical protein
MEIDQSIKNLKDRFISMSTDNTDQITGKMERVVRIEIDFKSNIEGYKWMVYGYPTNTDIKEQVIKCVKRNGNDDVYFLFSIDSSVGFAELLDHCNSIIKSNEDIERKKGIIESKLAELQQLFQKLTYDELITLKFVYETGKKPRKQSTKKTAVKEKYPKITKEKTIE